MEPNDNRYKGDIVKSPAKIVGTKGISVPFVWQPNTHASRGGPRYSALIRSRLCFTLSPKELQ
jgi:hypothetical protein